jgi:hypothetical protein
VEVRFHLHSALVVANEANQMTKMYFLVVVHRQVAAVFANREARSQGLIRFRV